jgi:small subunit ribosomal protein S19
MSRSIWKGPFLDNFLFLKKKNNKIWSRRSVIPSYLIGKMVLIHNGKIFKKIFINREKVGYKFGEFCNTRLLISKKNLKKK